MRQALASLSRYIITPRVAKHRVFIWLPAEVLADSATIVFARDDDYFFGMLHSRLHEVWSLRTCTWLGKGNDPRYTPTTTFETFPFPWPPGQEPTDHPAYRAISAAAQQLHAEREAWLNPPGLSGKALEVRTLTNLYNALAVFRGGWSRRRAISRPGWPSSLTRWIAPCATPTAGSTRSWRMRRRYCAVCWRSTWSGRHERNRETTTGARRYLEEAEIANEGMA
jgi:hypothetical protein